MLHLQVEFDQSYSIFYHDKNNIHANYNHKINQYGNKFIIELNELIYSYFGDTYHQPTTDNGVIFSKVITKISIHNKAVVSIGEPGLPIKTNVKSMSSGSMIPIKEGRKIFLLIMISIELILDCQ